MARTRTDSPPEVSSTALRFDLVWLNPAVLSLVCEEAERAWPYETGGVLMGFTTTSDRGRRGVVVDSAIGPGPLALHRRSSFVPDHEWQGDRIAEVYAASGRKHTYLGDWHTHPGGGSTPSFRDRWTLRSISLHVAARCPDPLMLIAGRRDPSSAWSLEVFQPAPGRLWPLSVRAIEIQRTK